MSAVLIALADVGPGLQLEEALTQAGAQATWDATQVDGPRGDARPMVVLIDADHLGLRLGDPEAARWHLTIASAVDPNILSGQLAQRLGMKSANGPR